jgi:hypothetical protein
VYGFLIERVEMLVAMMRYANGIPNLRDALEGA